MSLEYSGGCLDGEANWHSMISYPNYKYIFPMMALGMFAKKYGNPVLG